MQGTIAPYLLSTYQMINCAFPNGIESEAYLPLLALLYDEMSARSLARVVADYTGKDYYIVLNDVYRVKSTDVPDPEAIAAGKGASACLWLRRMAQKLAKDWQSVDQTREPHCH